MKTSRRVCSGDPARRSVTWRRDVKTKGTGMLPRECLVGFEGKETDVCGGPVSRARASCPADRVDGESRTGAQSQSDRCCAGTTEAVKHGKGARPPSLPGALSEDLVLGCSDVGQPRINSYDVASSGLPRWIGTIKSYSKIPALRTIFDVIFRWILQGYPVPVSMSPGKNRKDCTRVPG